MRASVSAVLVTSLLLTILVPAQADDASPQLVSGEGIRREGALAIRVEVLVLAPPGAAADERIALALGALGATAAEEIEPTPTYGLRWPQFVDADRGNNELVVQYNPAGSPAEPLGQQSFAIGFAAWNGIEDTTFRYTDGGGTDRCPSAWCGSWEEGTLLDGHNDVGWVDDLPPSWLGLSILAFYTETLTIVEGDVALNPNFPYSDDGSAVDMPSLFAHELGHNLGLDHSGDPGSIMYPSAFPGAFHRVPSPGDEAAVRELYPLRVHREPAPRGPPAIPEATFRLVARLGDELPGGGSSHTDFEPYGINNRGDLLYGTNYLDGEALLLATGGDTRVLARAGDAAPGGGTYGAGVWPAASLNEAGDVAFAFILEPFTFPFGLNTGLYLYDAQSRATRALVVPDVTPAPGGGVFRGVYVQPNLGDGGDVAFAGIVESPAGDLGLGVYLASRGGAIRAVAAPGTAAPGGSPFVYAYAPSINDHGEVAFLGYERGAPCGEEEEHEAESDDGPSTSYAFGCPNGAYVRDRAGVIRALARPGDALPRAGELVELDVPVLNSRGETLLPYHATEGSGLLLATRTGLTEVVLTGDEFGSTAPFLFQSPQPGNWDLTDGGAVAFSATIAEYDWWDESLATGLYVRTRGVTRVIAESGTVIPGVGVVHDLRPWAYDWYWAPLSGAALNERGEVLFMASLEDGSDALLVATPR